jgi:hypothetical protein
MNLNRILKALTTSATRAFRFVVALLFVVALSSVFVHVSGPVARRGASDSAVHSSSPSLDSPALLNPWSLVATSFNPSQPSTVSERQCERHEPAGSQQVIQIVGVPRIGGRNWYIGLIRARAEENGLPVDIADAVAFVESAYHPEKIGSVGEIGLMQVRPSTAFMLGFRGSDLELAAPETNVQYGVTYLARAWRLANADLCRALMKYRAGHGEEQMTARSLEYCDRANAYLKSINSPFARNLPALAFTRPISIATAPTPRVAPARSRSLVAVHARGPRDSQRFWAEHEARIRLLTKQAHARWRTLSQSKKVSSL